jgi:hypothetical protein
MRYGWTGLGLCCALIGCAGAGSQSAGTTASSHAAAPASALVTNASRVTRCAEEDNVYVKISGRALTGMRIEARQPSYIKQLSVDDSSADFSDCHFSKDENPVYPFEPKKLVLWENAEWVLVGNTYATFWRPNDVPVTVEGKVTTQLHLLQLHKKDPTEPSAGRHEFLVLYPPDGYWRAKPIPAEPLPSSTYGTSFLVGPITDAARPYVNIRSVEFVPSELTFKLSYEDGSHGTMKLLEITRERLALHYQQDAARADTQPLAAIRSMYVSDQKADVAEVVLRAAPAQSAKTTPISEFKQDQASEVAFGRTVISKHNPSAPDMWFGEFTLTPAAR